MVDAVTRVEKNLDTATSPFFAFSPLPYLSSKQTDTGKYTNPFNMFTFK